MSRVRPEADARPLAGQGSPDGDAECPAAPDLAGLTDAESAAVLVAQTATFSASFLRWMERRSPRGLNYARLRLIQALHCGGPAIMRDLGSQLGASPRNMTAIVDALEEAHLVVRRRHPTDRRATVIELSADGAREAEQELGPRIGALSEIFADLSPAERTQFSAILGKLMRAIKDRQGSC
ncbi:MAG TPA: MarR family transcriptional regulator [Streptosporangiaceae bacterium]|nr:MarR family transcriptional regulator [Streptosporangiaceae bacterium]